MFDLSGFRPGDASSLAGAWCRSAPADPITPARLRNLVLLDANFDPSGLRVARSPSGEVIGAAYAVRRRVPLWGADLEPTKGWIPFFFVLPSARGRGVGRALLADAISWLADRGTEEVTFAAYTPNYILPGCDRALYPAGAKLLEQLGFATVTQAVAMDRSLVGYSIPEEIRAKTTQLVSQGWRLGTPTDDDLVALVRLAGEHFTPDWSRAIRESLTGGLPLESIVVAADPSGELAGWAMHGAYEKVMERFGPFGVRGDQRGLGLGEVLLHLTLERMRALGAHTAWFLWTGEQTPAGHLYRKTGFTITRIFDVMRARLA
jgi:GNAT superfamily N-acetyltransferase